MKVRELKKHEDSRGWLIEVLGKDIVDTDLALVHFSVSKQGVIRGNHYHKRKIEWFCVVAGIAEIVIEDINNGQRNGIVVSGDEPRVIEIQPNQAHAIKNIGNSTMLLIVIVNEVYNNNDPDTFSKIILS